MARSSTKRPYCGRCDRWFSSLKAIQQHYDDSRRHYRCTKCSFDGTSWDDLLDHYRDTGHKIVCQGCDDGDGMTWEPNSQEYLDHLEDENVCERCERHFDSLSNLQQHKASHLKRTIECYGCYQSFKKYSHMMLHLDGGYCPSNITGVDLNQGAAECYQWAHYIDEDYREAMLDGLDLAKKYHDTVFPYTCPECSAVFAKISGLFQHIATPACSQTINSGAIKKLVRWLEKQYKL